MFQGFNSSETSWIRGTAICGLTQTLIVDADGVDDPRLLNDRLLLGLKGTMSEFELCLFRQRAREAFERKIRSGHAMWELPVGFVRTEEHRVEKIADRQVQSALQGVFAKFPFKYTAFGWPADRFAPFWFGPSSAPRGQCRWSTASYRNRGVP